MKNLTDKLRDRLRRFLGVPARTVRGIAAGVA